MRDHERLGSLRRKSLTVKALVVSQSGQKERRGTGYLVEKTPSLAEFLKWQSWIFTGLLLLLGF